MDQKLAAKLEELGSSEHPGFALDLDGKAYAVALYYAGGGAYNASAKIIFNTALTSLLVPVTGEDGAVQVDAKNRPIKRPLLWKCYWTIGFKKVTFGNFTPWHPILRLQAKNETGPEVRTYCQSLVQGQTQTVEEASSAE